MSILENFFSPTTEITKESRFETDNTFTDQSVRSYTLSDSRSTTMDYTYAPVMIFGSAGATASPLMKKELSSSPYMEQGVSSSPTLAQEEHKAESRATDKSSFEMNSSFLMIAAAAVGAYLILGGKK